MNCQLIVHVGYVINYMTMEIHIVHGFHHGAYIVNISSTLKLCIKAYEQYLELQVITLYGAF